MFRDLSLQAVTAGLLAAFVGSASSFAVVIAGLTAIGADPAEATSGLMALSLAMGFSAIILSLRLRQPVSIAWSTPGAALLASSAALDGGFATAVAAFLIAGALVVLAGLIRPFGRAVAAIPAPLANAMLAGVLLGLCIAPVKAVAAYPVAGLLVFLTWAVVGRIRPLMAVPAAVVATIVAIVLLVDAPGGTVGEIVARPVFVVPEFGLTALGLAVPLFVVTMASQNIPGIAVLNVNGYRPEPGPLFTATGIFSLLAAPFGGHAVNLAAITAALCAGPEAHPDPARRYWAAIVAGIFYIVFGAFAGAATALAAVAPPVLIQAVAGLALLGSFASAVVGAVKDEGARQAAIVTFVTTASGLAFAGVSGAFWGLLAGGAMLGLTRMMQR
ncbi:MAG: benzoate/H(+) symporter BenE family transporter [Pseudomonadota bacterium]|nr:benzoate/H(+) symporter BenE family transporter [Pseudomonadota bacterium]